MIRSNKKKNCLSKKSSRKISENANDLPPLYMMRFDYKYYFFRSDGSRKWREKENSGWIAHWNDPDWKWRWWRWSCLWAWLWDRNPWGFSISSRRTRRGKKISKGRRASRIWWIRRIRRMGWCANKSNQYWENWISSRKFSERGKKNAVSSWRKNRGRSCWGRLKERGIERSGGKKQIRR